MVMSSNNQSRWLTTKDGGQLLEVSHRQTMEAAQQLRETCGVGQPIRGEWLVIMEDLDLTLKNNLHL